MGMLGTKYRCPGSVVSVITRWAISQALRFSLKGYESYKNKSINSPYMNNHVNSVRDAELITISRMIARDVGYR